MFKNTKIQKYRSPGTQKGMKEIFSLSKAVNLSLMLRNTKIQMQRNTDKQQEKRDEGGFLTFIPGELFTDPWKGYKGATTS